MFLRNFSIGKKIALAFSIIAIINLGFGLFLISELGKVKNELLNYTDDTLPALQNVDSIKDKMSYWRRTQFSVLLLKDPAEVRQTLNRNEQVRKEIESGLEAYGKNRLAG